MLTFRKADQGISDLMIFRYEFELQILHNQILLRRTSGHAAIDRKALYKFSNADLLIADQTHLEEELKHAFKEAASGLRLLPFSRLTVVITTVSQPLAPVERVALHAAIRNLGAGKIIDKATPEPVYRKLN
ncbi:hypothetical protein D2V04_03800 [Pelagerythrobacter aerophilus]|uniref:Uncharacterized protein n=1 Tax=Pelagerythrobacter aerophilus TaxID=2306995 RepID=A0A418NKI5_9SPHN|nr:hypothetical protein D2V04_03800 [Pelagerythrobacter aerophilus]